MRQKIDLFTGIWWDSKYIDWIEMGDLRVIFWETQKFSVEMWRDFNLDVTSTAISTTRYLADNPDAPTLICPHLTYFWWLSHAGVRVVPTLTAFEALRFWITVPRLYIFSSFNSLSHSIKYRARLTQPKHISVGLSDRTLLGLLSVCPKVSSCLKSFLGQIGPPSRRFNKHCRKIYARGQDRTIEPCHKSQ